MPGEIRSFGQSGPGAFWTGMLDWVDGLKTIDEVFIEIDDVWVELNASGGS